MGCRHVVWAREVVGRAGALLALCRGRSCSTFRRVRMRMSTSLRSACLDGARMTGWCVTSCTFILQQPNVVTSDAFLNSTSRASSLLFCTPLLNTFAHAANPSDIRAVQAAPSACCSTTAVRSRTKCTLQSRQKKVLLFHTAVSSLPNPSIVLVRYSIYVCANVEHKRTTWFHLQKYITLSSRTLCSHSNAIRTPPA